MVEILAWSSVLKSDGLFNTYMHGLKENTGFSIHLIMLRIAEMEIYESI